MASLNSVPLPDHLGSQHAYTSLSQFQTTLKLSQSPVPTSVAAPSRTSQPSTAEDSKLMPPPPGVQTRRKTNGFPSTPASTSSYHTSKASAGGEVNQGVMEILDSDDEHENGSNSKGKNPFGEDCLECETIHSC